MAKGFFDRTAEQAGISLTTRFGGGQRHFRSKKIRDAVNVRVSLTYYNR